MSDSIQVGPYVLTVDDNAVMSVSSEDKYLASDGTEIKDRKQPWEPVMFALFQEVQRLRRELERSRRTLRDKMAMSVQTPNDLTVAWGETLVRKYPLDASGKPAKFDNPEVLQWWADVDAAYRYFHADALLKARAAYTGE